MPITTIVRLAGLAAILGGSLRVLTSFLPPMPVVALELLYLAVDLPLLLAVLGIHADQRPYTGRTAFAGFLLAVAGFALIVGPDGNLGPVAVYPVGALAISAGLAFAIAGARMLVPTNGEPGTDTPPHTRPARGPAGEAPPGFEHRADPTARPTRTPEWRAPPART